jgi:uncharacterized protein YpuA (DUF1002 family)
MSIPTDNKQIAEEALAAARAGADAYTYLAGQWNAPRDEVKKRVFEALYDKPDAGAKGSKHRGA